MSFDYKDALIMGGLGTAGLGAYLYGKYSHKKALDKVLAEDAIRRNSPDYSVPTKEEYEKLRDVSGLDVNIGGYSPADLRAGADPNNAYFILQNTPGKGRGYLADKLKGKSGTVLLGPDSRSITTLAHELGHSRNYKEGRLSSRRRKQFTATLLSGALGFLIGKGGYALLRYLRGTDKLSPEAHAGWSIAPSVLAGLAAGVGSWIGDSYGVDEEEEATKNALKYLKEYGHKSSELRKDKKNLELALDTYRKARLANALRYTGIGLGAGALSYGFNKWWNS